jgi:hypothetical protein
MTTTVYIFTITSGEQQLAVPSVRLTPSHRSRGIHVMGASLSLGKLV